MKYLKYSIIVFVFAIVLNGLVVNAYTTTPVSFTGYVSTLAHTTSSNKTKDTLENKKQLFEVSSSNSITCDNCTYKARIYGTDGYGFSIKSNLKNGNRVAFNDYSAMPGDYYSDVWRSDWGFKKYCGFTYAPNGTMY